MYAYNVGNMSRQTRQYTVRNLPPELDRTLRERCRETGKSLNEVVIETLKRGSGVAEEPPIYHDLDFMARTWVEDPEFDKVLEAQEEIDEEMWK